MRVLVLTQYYDPEPIPRPVEVAEELVRLGHEVTVLTGLPNYPSGVLATGYGRTVYRRESIRGVAVIRVFEYPYHGPSARRRMINYGTFAVSAAIASLGLPRADAVFVCHPPLTIALTAWVIRTFRRSPFVYDVQDIWPDAILMSGMMRDGRAARILRRLERAAYNWASSIVVLTDGARRNLLAKGVDSEKIAVIPPWAYGATGPSVDDAAIASARTDLGAGDRFIVTFAGNVGLVQGLDTVVRAASMLRHDPRIVFRIVGDGMERTALEALADELRADNVRFLGPRPGAQIPALLAASDALLVHLRAGPLTDLYLPAKTLNYLSAGRPIVMAMTGEAAGLVQACGAGLVVPPDEPSSLARAVTELADMPAARRQEMGERGRRCVEERFSRHELVLRLESLLRQACS